MQKGFSSLILVVMVILIGGGLFYAGYQYSQKQTPSVVQSTPAVISTPTPDETQIRQVFEEAISSGRGKVYKDYYASITKIAIEGEWATVPFVLKIRNTGENVGMEPSIAIGNRINGVWDIVFEGEEKFKQWLIRVPDSIFSPSGKEYYKVKYQ